VVHEHADPALRPGTEVAQVLDEVVDALEVLHDDALQPQVVPPDPLDELGVVAALDEDPAGPCDPCQGVGHGDRAGRRTRRGLGSAAGRGHQDHRHTLQQEAGAQREGAPLAAPVLEGDGVQVPLDGDDLAAPVGADLLDDQPTVGLDLDRPSPSGRAPVRAQDIGAVAVGHRAHGRAAGRTGRSGTPTLVEGLNDDISLTYHEHSWISEGC
jgi:hypothetical protein